MRYRPPLFLSLVPHWNSINDQSQDKYVTWRKNVVDHFGFSDTFAYETWPTFSNEYNYSRIVEKLNM